MLFLEGRRELNPVAHSKVALLRLVDIDPLKTAGIVCKLLAILAAYGEQVFLDMNLSNGRVLASFYPDTRTSARVTEGISKLVLRGPLAISSGEFMPGGQDRNAEVLLVYASLRLKSEMDLAVNLEPAFVVRRNHEARVRLSEIILGDGFQPFFLVSELVDPPLFLQ